MKGNQSKKIGKIAIYSIVCIFALIGFSLTGAYLAVKLHLTNDPGQEDYNDRYFQEISNKYGNKTKSDTLQADKEESILLQKISVLSKYYPENAFYIMDAYSQSKNVGECLRMVDAASIHLQDNQVFLREIGSLEASRANKGSIFQWMNIKEWQDFKLAVAKDKHLIDSAALVTGVEPRMIVAVLVGEQIRLFNSSREAYKKWIGPLKILSVETTFSLGVTGIKVPTAQRIEHQLKDTSSVFYLGKEYEHLLDFQTNNIESERISRLTSYKNHYYSYLYAALNVKQIKMQWERAGFPIDNRPEILATLFNIGFEVSNPKSNPVVGGSGIDIYDKKYTFGAVAYEFYYSGELFNLFPFKPQRFDWNQLS